MKIRLNRLVILCVIVIATVVEVTFCGKANSAEKFRKGTSAMETRSRAYLDYMTSFQYLR